MCTSGLQENADLFEEIEIGKVRINGFCCNQGLMRFLNLKPVEQRECILLVRDRRREEIALHLWLFLEWRDICRQADACKIAGKGLAKVLAI